MKIIDTFKEIDLTIDSDEEISKYKKLIRDYDVILKKEEFSEVVKVTFGKELDRMVVTYKKVSLESIYDKIKNKKNIDISNSFLDNFYFDDYTSNDYVTEDIGNFNSENSFYSGSTTIKRLKANEKTISFKNAIFEENLCFQNNKFEKCKVYFNDAIVGFSQNSDLFKFSNNTLNASSVYFKNMVFNKCNAEFNSCKFLKTDASFSFTKIFESNFNFMAIDFDYSLTFGSTEITNSNLQFYCCEFLNNFGFSDSKVINSEIDFKGNKIGTKESRTTLWFEKVEFDESSLKFDDVNFINCKIFITMLTLRNKSDFLLIRSNFEKVDFEQYESIGIKCLDSRVEISSCKFNEAPINFSRSTITNSEIVFNDSELSNSGITFNFSNCSNSTMNMLFCKFKESTIFFFGSKILNCEMLFQFLELNNSNIAFNSSNCSGSEIKIFSIDFETGTLVAVGSTFNNLQMDSCHINKDIEILCKAMNTLAIENCNIKSDLFLEKGLDIDGNVIFNKYEKLSFIGTKCNGNIYINLKENNVEKSIENYLADEKYDIKIQTQCKSEQYRMLKNNFNNIGYYEDEDKALVKYMDNYLELSNEKGKKLLKRIFSKIGAYGTDPMSIFKWSLIIVFIFAIIYTFSNLYEINRGQPVALYNTSLEVMSANGFVTKDVIVYETLKSVDYIKSFFDSIYFSGITFLTIGYGDITPTNSFVKGFTILEGFLGVFMMSYFSVSIVRKILR